LYSRPGSSWRFLAISVTRRDALHLRAPLVEGAELDEDLEVLGAWVGAVLGAAELGEQARGLGVRRSRALMWGVSLRPSVRDMFPGRLKVT